MEVKFEIKLKAKEPINGYKTGETVIIVNPIFDRNIGIAFFPIDKNFDIVYQRQFIGVVDENNKDVYFGDKVKGRYMVQRSLDPNAEPEIIYFEGVIKYAEGCFYVKADNGQCAFSFTYPDYELEVVGNEFEGVA